MAQQRTKQTQSSWIQLITPDARWSARSWNGRHDWGIQSRFSMCSRWLALHPKGALCGSSNTHLQPSHAQSLELLHRPWSRTSDHLTIDWVSNTQSRSLRAKPVAGWFRGGASCLLIPYCRNWLRPQEWIGTQNGWVFHWHRQGSYRSRACQ